MNEMEGSKMKNKQKQVALSALASVSGCVADASRLYPLSVVEKLLRIFPSPSGCSLSQVAVLCGFPPTTRPLASEASSYTSLLAFLPIFAAFSKSSLMPSSYLIRVWIELDIARPGFSLNARDASLPRLSDTLNTLIFFVQNFVNFHRLLFYSGA